jgi:hypothetical protein
MIQTILHREYAVGCDGCGQLGPCAASAEEASRVVRTRGWESRTPNPRFAFLTTWLCPACLQHREAAGTRTAGSTDV